MKNKSRIFFHAKSLFRFSPRNFLIAILAAGVLSGCSGGGEGGGGDSPSTSTSVTASSTITATGGSVNINGKPVVELSANATTQDAMVTVETRPSTASGITDEVVIDLGGVIPSATVPSEISVYLYSQTVQASLMSFTLPGNTTSYALDQIVAVGKIGADLALRGRLEYDVAKGAIKAIFSLAGFGVQAVKTIQTANNISSFTKEMIVNFYKAENLDNTVRLYRFDSATSAGIEITAVDTDSLINGKIPLVLVHGIQSFHSPMSPAADACGKNSAYRDTWKELLGNFFATPDGLAQKYVVYSLSYPTNLHFKDNGKSFSQKLSEAFGNRPVVVVAHSMGGLVTRAADALYGEKNKSGNDTDINIARVITLNTPHHGTPYSDNFGALSEILCMGNSAVTDGGNSLAWDGMETGGSCTNAVLCELNTPSPAAQEHLKKYVPYSTYSIVGTTVATLADPSEWALSLMMEGAGPVLMGVAFPEAVINNYFSDAVAKKSDFVVLVPSQRLMSIVGGTWQDNPSLFARLPDTYADIAHTGVHKNSKVWAQNADGSAGGIKQDLLNFYAEISASTTPPTCTLPQVLTNGVCVTPPTIPTCTLPQVLTNGVCVTPPPTDTTKPIVSGFSVTPGSLTAGSSFTIFYTVSDSGGSGLWRAQLWRAPDIGGVAGTWGKIATTPLSGNGPVSESFTDAPTTGTYWYGVHGVDTAINVGIEPSGVKVVVNPAAIGTPSTPTGAATSGVIGTSSGPGPVTPSSTVNMSWNTSSGTGVDFNLIVTDITNNTQALDIRLPGNTYTTPLMAGHQYNWQVAACNATGCSPYTAAQYFQTPVAAPTTPEVFSVSPSTLTQGTSFQNVTITGAKFTSASYHQYSVSGGSTWAWATSPPIINSPNSMTVAVNDTAVQTIYFRVCASNGSTLCSGSQTVTVQPAAPITPTLSSISPNPITQGTSYQNVTFSGSDFTASSYHQYSVSGGSSWAWATSPPIINSPNSMTVAVNNTVMQTIYFRVCASNGSSACSGSVPVTIQPPVVSSLVVNGVAGSYSGTGQKTIPLSGSGFNSITQISWSCTMPNGTTPCTGSPYVWTPGTARWNNVTITSDTVATVYPTFLIASDSPGTYNWNVIFSGGGQPVTKYFMVTK